MHSHAGTYAKSAKRDDRNGFRLAIDQPSIGTTCVTLHLRSASYWPGQRYRRVCQPWPPRPGPRPRRAQPRRFSVRVPELRAPAIYHGSNFQQLCCAAQSIHRRNRVLSYFMYELPGHGIEAAEKPISCVHHPHTRAVGSRGHEPSSITHRPPVPASSLTAGWREDLTAPPCSGGGGGVRGEKTAGAHDKHGSL
jgi:hypothetical protein